MTDTTPTTDKSSKKPNAAQDNTNQDATATSFQNRANEAESRREGNSPDNAATLGRPNQAQNTEPNLSRTPEHAQGANAGPANDPNAVAAAAAAASGGTFDQTTSSQVAARVNTGHTGLARGVGVAVGQLPADTIIEVIKGAKGSLDLVTSSLTELIQGVDGIGDAELSKVQAAVDSVQQQLNGILHLGKVANESAHTDASKS